MLVYPDHESGALGVKRSAGDLPVVEIPLLIEELLGARPGVEPLRVLNDSLGIVPDLDVGVDELAVDVADDGALGLQLEEERASADERLEVPAEAARRKAH